LLLKLPDDALSHEFFRLKIDMQMKVADALRGHRPDGGDFRPANLARVVVEFEKHFEKSVYAVRTAKHDPVVGVRVLNQFTEFTQIGWWFDPDRRQFKNICTQRAKLIAQYVCVLPRSGDNDSFSGKRSVLVPF
jgi:hypothetical protein